MEGIHIGFLRKMEGVREAAGMQALRTYINRRKATVAQWVALRPLFEVYAQETWYKGGGRRREAWWCQGSSEKQLRSTMEDSQEAKRRRSGGENVTQ